MYTGTLIRDLMRTVERAERTVRQKQLADERELQMLVTSQLSLVQDLTVLVGAA
jgi:hypothetical protein